jgi:hypothetical protein
MNSVRTSDMSSDLTINIDPIRITVDLGGPLRTFLKTFWGGGDQGSGQGSGQGGGTGKGETSEPQASPSQASAPQSLEKVHGINPLVKVLDPRGPPETSLGECQTIMIACAARAGGQAPAMHYLDWMRANGRTSKTVHTKAFKGLKKRGIMASKRGSDGRAHYHLTEVGVRVASEFKEVIGIEAFNKAWANCSGGMRH